MRNWSVSTGGRILLAALALVSAIPSLAGTEDIYDVDVPRLPLRLAMIKLIKQLDARVGYIPESPDDEWVLVGPVKGRYSRDAAVRALLRETGLGYSWLDDDFLTIRFPPGGLDSRQSKSRRSFRMKGGADELEFVIVRSTRLSGISSERAAVTKLHAGDIESHGVATLGELAEYIPQVPFVRSADFRTTGEQYADLRGLGAGATLMLINGRRAPTTATSYDNSGFDVNAIPITAVQEVQILHDSPSLSVGGDAIGGVINILLKDDIPRPVMAMRYGTAEGGAEERRFSLAGGTSFGDFHGAATFDAFHRSALLGIERDRSRNQDYRRFGGQDWRSPDAMPGNVRSLSGANLPGLGFNFAAIPAGSSGIDLTPADFAATAGQRNLTSLHRYRSIVPESSRVSLTATGKLEFAPGFVAFGEFMGSMSAHEIQLEPPTLSGFPVPSSNPFNPFGVPVAVNTLLSEMEPRTFVTNTTLARTVVGAQIDWSTWESEMAAVWSREDTSLQQQGNIDPVRVMHALASPDEASALNPFRDGPIGNPELLASLRAPPRTSDHISSAAQVYARAKGPVVVLPSGEITLTAGVEWRREGMSNPLLPSSIHRDVTGAFAETRVPLLAPHMEIPGLLDLSVSGGARADDYGGIGTSTTWQGGMSWRPLRDWRVRAAYSTSYRPPSLHELYWPKGVLPLTATDPRRNNEPATIVVTGGGNPELRPSTARSRTIGVAFDSQDLANLHSSVGYWHINVDEAFSPIPLAAILGREELFPGRVTRAPPTDQDIQAGQPGALRTLDVSLGNFNLMSTDGVDVSVSTDWTTRVGRFRPSLVAVWTRSFKTSPAPAAPLDDRIDVATLFGTIPKWRGVVSLEWTRGPLALTSTVRLAGNYADTYPLSGQKTGRDLPTRSIFDVQAALHTDSFAFAESLLSGAVLTVGVSNLFDNNPSFAEIGVDRGFDVSQGNLRKRFWYGRFLKKF